MATAVLRQATRADIAAMHRVRLAVRENVLVSVASVTEQAYVEHLERGGSGWVVEDGGKVVALAAANRHSGNVWALFVHPDHERRGYGRALHDTMLQWLWAEGVPRAWLSTEPGTRAQRFYERAGWRCTGATAHGEVGYEMIAPPRVR